MDIRNFTQFVNILVSTQTVHMHPAFDKLMVCVMTYNSICVCGGKGAADRNNKAAECNRIYRDAIMASDKIKAHLFQQTTDNTITFYINDAHQIKTLVR